MAKSSERNVMNVRTKFGRQADEAKRKRIGGKKPKKTFVQWRGQRGYM